ncbi:hypothetical protein BJ912DRAFT_1063345 [Pholiota molesta]|nr:hypothetical protein BJ912DRAFT_1063345 [Pholiota molesta]
MEALKRVFCGNPSCPAVLEKPKECASCKARSYCSRDCQRADWPAHRPYCSPSAQLSSDANTIRAYDRQHRNMILNIALDFFLFHRSYSHLRGNNRLQFLPHARAQYLHITLRRVNRPPGLKGRHNRVSFVTARPGLVDDLPDEHRADILSRLQLRFPAVCFGYSIINTLNPSQVKVTTITHAFQWPPAATRGFGISKSVRLIWVSEWFLVREAREAMEAKIQRQGGGQ